MSDVVQTQLSDAIKIQPTSGQHIFASYDDKTVTMYQTFRPAAADFAVKNGFLERHDGHYDSVLWLKTSLMWVMHKSGGVANLEKEKILAIKVDRQGFEELLRMARFGYRLRCPYGKVFSESVVLQWTPDFEVNGELSGRLTLLIGIKPKLMQQFNSSIQSIHDITDMVKEQLECAIHKTMCRLPVPLEHLFIPADKELCKDLMIDGFEIEENNEHETTIVSDLLTDEHIKRNHSEGKQIVVCLQGMFNPVHTKHIEAMIQIKKWLEENTSNKVVAGVFVVHNDEQLEHKLKHSNTICIKAYHRTNMCKIASKEYEWMYTYYKGESSLQKQIEIENKNIGRPLQWLFAFGGDRALELVRKGCKLDNCIFIGRSGITKEVKTCYDRLAKRKRKGSFFIPIEIGNVSSTIIRQTLRTITYKSSEIERLEVIQRMVESDWIDADVGQYILHSEHEFC